VDAHFGYLAIVTDQPDKLADFYAQHFQTREATATFVWPCWVAAAG
jgi:hypothetical protein